MAESQNDNLTPEELRGWLRSELAGLTKETQLRVAIIIASRCDCLQLRHYDGSAA